MPLPLQSDEDFEFVVDGSPSEQLDDYASSNSSGPMEVQRLKQNQNLLPHDKRIFRILEKTNEESFITPTSK